MGTDQKDDAMSLSRKVDIEYGPTEIFFYLCNTNDDRSLLRPKSGV